MLALTGLSLLAGQPGFFINCCRYRVCDIYSIVQGNFLLSILIIFACFMPLLCWSVKHAFNIEITVQLYYLKGYMFNRETMQNCNKTPIKWRNSVARRPRVCINTRLVHITVCMYMTPMAMKRGAMYTNLYVQEPHEIKKNVFENDFANIMRKSSYRNSEVNNFPGKRM